MFSKLRLYLLLVICGILLFIYIFLYKIDINSTVARVGSIIIAGSGLSGNTKLSSAVTLTPENKVKSISPTTVTVESKDGREPTPTKTFQNANLTDQPKEAFVTFSNNQPTYLALLKVLLDSVHAFSTRPIIVFGIDVDPDIDLKQYPRAIKRRIKQSDCGASVFFCKIHAIVNSHLDYGVLMETDDVVNYSVDVLFDVLHVWPYPLPLSPRHPDDPRNYDHFMQQHGVPKRTMPYIHAHIIWTYRAYPFLKNVQSLLQQGHFQGSNFDETAVNVMLWKAKANHTLCKYDPYFTYGKPYEEWPTIINCTQYCHTAFVTLHGCKDASISAALLKRLKANAGKPYIQTLGASGMHYLNDSSVTCCYPDSKPSPLHPLLCEHPSS